MNTKEEIKKLIKQTFSEYIFTCFLVLAFAFGMRVISVWLPIYRILSVMAIVLLLLTFDNYIPLILVMLDFHKGDICKETIRVMEMQQAEGMRILRGGDRTEKFYLFDATGKDYILSLKEYNITKDLGCLIVICSSVLFPMFKICAIYRYKK